MEKTDRVRYFFLRILPLVFLGALLIGYCWLLLTYFVPVTGGVDQNGYHISARMYNLDGVFYRKTADDLQHVGHMWVVNERGEFYPKYPPFYPWLAAGLNRLLGEGGGFYATVWGALLAVAGMYALTSCFRIGRYYALGAAALLAASPVVFALALAKNSHTPSLAFFLWGLTAVCFAAERGGKYRWMFAALGGALVGFTVGIRYTDFLLIFVPLGFALFMAPKPLRWKLFGAILAGAAIPYAALALFHWQAYGAPWRSGYSLTDESGAFALRFIWANLQIYLPDFFTLAIGPFGVLAFLVWRWRWRQAGFWACWILPTLGLYLMYYWAPDGESVGALRFLVPLFPAVILLALFSLRRLITAMGRRGAVLLTLALLLTLQGVWSWTRATRQGEQRFASDFSKAVLLESLRLRVPEGAVIISSIGNLNELDFEQRWLLYPSLILNPAETRRLIERSLGAQAAGLQKTRAERIHETLGTLDHNQLSAYLRDFFGEKVDAGIPVYFVGRPGESNRFQNSFYRYFEVDNLGMLTGSRPAWLLRDIKPASSRYRPREEPSPLPVYELLCLGERRSKVLPLSAGVAVLAGERSGLMNRLNPENDPELQRELNRLESIREETTRLRHVEANIRARERERRLQRELERLKKQNATPSQEPESQKSVSGK